MMSGDEMQHLVLAQEGVAVAGHVHVLIPVQNQAHRAAQVVSRHRVTLTPCCVVWVPNKVQLHKNHLVCGQDHIIV